MTPNCQKRFDIININQSLMSSYKRRLAEVGRESGTPGWVWKPSERAERGDGDDQGSDVWSDRRVEDHPERLVILTNFFLLGCSHRDV